MRIAMIGHKRVPSRDGGVEIVVEQLAERLVKKGHQVTLFNRQKKQTSVGDLKLPVSKIYKGIRLRTVLTIDVKGIAAVSSSFFAAIKTALGKYDVVHFHAEGSCAMLWIPKFFGKKCVVTIHGLDHQRSKWGGFAKRYILFGEKCAVKYADEIIVLSENIKKYFRETYNRETCFIPNGVIRPRLMPPKEIKERFALEKEQYILFLGRIVPEKGVHYLIEAYRHVKTNKRLVIAGGPSDSKDYFEMVKEAANSDERVLFTGFVSGSVLEELYSNAFLYILPSELEGMPLSLLEALSYGNCCIVSDIPECREVVEDKAVVFPKGDVKALGSVIQCLLDDVETVENYKAKAAQFVLGKYNWDDVSDETEALYR